MARLQPPRALFGLDSRSLAVFRVGLGVLVALDAVDRLPDVAALYTDAGVLPRELVVMKGSRPSPLWYLDGEGWVVGLLVVQLLAGLAMVAGRGTRPASVLAFVATAFVQARNPWALYGSDLLLRAMLWWSWFLPLEERGRRQVLSMATAGYTVQIAVLYLATWALKTGDPWHGEGTAGWYALNGEIFTQPWSSALLAYPRLLEVGTHLTMALELWGPLLLFLPLWTARVRLAVIATMWAFHAVLGATMAIGWWPGTSIVCWVPLVPGLVWDRLGWRTDAAPRPERGRLHAPATGLVAALTGVVVWWNLASVSPRSFPIHPVFRRTVLALRVDQYWNMYAPSPLTDDGWFVVGTRRGDERVDLLTGEALDWHKPPSVSGKYGGLRWRKYVRSLWQRRTSELREPYLQWWCDRTEPRPDKVTLWHVTERTPPPGVRPDPAKTVKLLTTTCAPLE